MNGDKKNILLKAIKGLPVEAIEASFKLSDAIMLDTRYLIGIDKDQIPPATLKDIFAQINMPSDYQNQFFDQLGSANQILFAVEQDNHTNTCILKTYLEFWDHITTQIRQNPHDHSSRLMHLGFKWHASDNSKQTITSYHCHPLLTIPQIESRIKQLYLNHSDNQAVETVLDIIQLAARRISRDSFIYLQATEQDNSRHSFDLNLYKADLKMDDISPLIAQACSRYHIPSDNTSKLLERIKNHPLGHISGGLNRDGNDFLTFYYEISPEECFA